MKTKAVNYFIGIIAITLILSCKSEEENNLYTFDNVELCVDDQYIIPNGEDFEWRVTDPEIAIVEGNTIYAKSIGFTQVVTMNSTYHFFNLSVKPILLFEQPCLEWNYSKEDIKNYMQEYNIINESENEIAYEGKNKELQISYLFDNDKYSNVVIFIDRRSVSWDLFINHMCYYYILEDVDSEDMFFSTNDYNTLIKCEFVNNNGYSLCVIIFQPTNNLPHN